MAGPIVYDLTPMTKAGEARRTVIFTFDVPLAAVVTGAILVLPALVLTAFLWAFIGVYATLAFFVFEGLGLYAFLQRSKRGMRTKVWQSVLDSKVNHNGEFVLAGNSFDLDQSSLIYIVPSSVPASAV